MTSTGHKITGIAAAIISFGSILHMGIKVRYPVELSTFLLAVISLIPAYLGSLAPDRLEIARWDKNGRRHSLIEHRTITHWIPLWVIAFFVSYFFINHLLGVIFYAYSIGGLMHLAMDIPNPMGVPLLTPSKKSRVSLNWWKSGKYDLIISLTILCLSFYFFIYRGHYAITI